MTFFEKPTDPTKPAHWRGDMQADYFYSNGTAGDRFFKHIMNNDTFLASKCPQCEKVLFPPKLYCPECFCEIPEENWSEVVSTGTVRLNTTAMMDAHGEPLEDPAIIGLIDIDGTDGAILSRINTNDIGMDLTGKRVKAVLRSKDKREGTLKDILYFDLI